MIFEVIGLVIVTVLLYLVVIKIAPVPTVSQNGPTSDSEMMNDSQIRENPWVGFLQEDVRQGSGSTGDFRGAYTLQKIRVYDF